MRRPPVRSLRYMAGLYRPSHVAFTNLINAIDALTILGFLKGVIAPRQKGSFKVRGARRSTFEATSELLQTLKDLGVGAHNVVTIAEAQQVRLLLREAA